MTGKDLILYILQNNLENEQVFKNGRFLSFLTVEEAAAKFGVGPATIHVWFEFDGLEGVKIGDDIFISQNAAPPKELNFEMSGEKLQTFIRKYYTEKR